MCSQVQGLIPIEIQVLVKKRMCILCGKDRKGLKGVPKEKDHRSLVQKEGIVGDEHTLQQLPRLYDDNTDISSNL